MPRYRHALPQLSGPKVFLTDGGLETTLVFLDGIDLPGFAAFPLVACSTLRPLPIARRAAQMLMGS